jgi:hypothetical protein
MDTIEQSEASSRRWKWFGMNYPRQEVVFFAQIIIIYAVIIASIINLSIGGGNTNLWTVMLSSCLGYLLPNPSIKKNGALLRNPSE